MLHRLIILFLMVLNLHADEAKRQFFSLRLIDQPVVKKGEQNHVDKITLGEVIINESDVISFSIETGELFLSDLAHEKFGKLKLAQKIGFYIGDKLITSGKVWKMTSSVSSDGLVVRSSMTRASIFVKKGYPTFDFYNANNHKDESLLVLLSKMFKKQTKPK